METMVAADFLINESTFSGFYFNGLTLEEIIIKVSMAILDIHSWTLLNTLPIWYMDTHFYRHHGNLGNPKF